MQIPSAFPITSLLWALPEHKYKFRLGMNIPKELKLFYNYEMQTNPKYSNNNIITEID